MHTVNNLIDTFATNAFGPNIGTAQTAHINTFKGAVRRVFEFFGATTAEQNNLVSQTFAQYMGEQTQNYLASNKFRKCTEYFIPQDKDPVVLFNACFLYINTKIDNPNLTKVIYKITRSVSVSILEVGMLLVGIKSSVMVAALVSIYVGGASFVIFSIGAKLTSSENTNERNWKLVKSTCKSLGIAAVSFAATSMIINVYCLYQIFVVIPQNACIDISNATLEYRNRQN